MSTTRWEGEAPAEPIAKRSIREGEAPAEPIAKRSIREGEDPAEPPPTHDPQRLRGSVALPAEPIAKRSIREGEDPAEPPPTHDPQRLRGSVALPAEPIAKRSIREGEDPAEPPPTHDPQRLRGSVALPAEPLPKRRHPLHGIKYVDGQPTIIFDTICTKHRKSVLANDEFHTIFREVAANATAWLMGRYVIMPDHIHFFAGDAGDDIPYENWITYLKSRLTKALGGRGSGGRGSGGRGSRRAADVPFRWQTDHWDTRVRSADVYEEKWLYVRNNPVRKGFVAAPDDWPFQGEVFELRW